MDRRSADDGINMSSTDHGVNSRSGGQDINISSGGHGVNMSSSSYDVNMSSAGHVANSRTGGHKVTMISAGNDMTTNSAGHNVARNSADTGYTDNVTHSDSETSANRNDSDMATITGQHATEPSYPRVVTGSYDFVRTARDDDDEGSEVEISTDSDFDSDQECSSLSVSECDNDDNVIDNNDDYINNDDQKQTVAGRPSELIQPELDEVDSSCIFISGVKRGSFYDDYGDMDTQFTTSRGMPLSLSGPYLTKRSRTSSYEQACAEDTSIVRFPNDMRHVGSGGREMPVGDVQSSRDSSPEVSDANDPHGLIRKPAMRRKGYAWSSKSLPRNTESDHMRHTFRNSIDSSQDLESSLVSIYGRQLRKEHKPNDDHVAPQAARKTWSLPTRTDQLDETHFPDLTRATPRPTSVRLVSNMEVEASLPLVVGTSSDKISHLAMTSESSRTLSPSSNLSKKKEDVTDDMNRKSCLGNMISDSTETSDNISEQGSTLESRYSTDSDLFSDYRNGGAFKDNTSFLSSENDNSINASESLPITTPTSSDNINLPFSENSQIMLASSFESSSVGLDFKSPRKQPYHEDSAANNANILHMSPSAASRHEARMKFFTNYEDHLHQMTPKHEDSLTRATSMSSKSQPPAFSQNSSVSSPSSVTKTSRSGVEGNNRDYYSRSSTQETNPFAPPIPAFEDRKDLSKMSRSLERSSRRSDRRGSNSKHEGTSFRSGFSRSSKKRDHVAASDPGNRTSQGFVSYVSRVVTEIVESERTYIASLEDIIHGYLEPMEKMLTSNDAKTDIKCLFSNIRDIYKFGCTFLAHLETAGTDCVKVAQCFVRHNKGFVIYTDYCTNYPRAVEVLTRFMQHPELSELCKQRQLALGHGLPLGAYLLKPVQRILKYHLLLHNLVKNCDKGKEEADILEQAFHHMTEMAHHINEMKRKHEHAVRIQEIQSQLEDYVGEDLTRLGELVLEGTFKVYGAKASRQVFLFERGLLISKRKGGGMLSCKTFIQCSNLMLVEVIPNEPLSFHIIPFDNPRAQYTLQARNMEQKRKWCQDIKQLILESFKGRIPDNVKNLIMQLGREHDDDYVSKEALEAGRKNQHTAPEYLEKRRFRGKSGSRIPDFSLLKAKRGGNKKNEVRPRESVSQERPRRRESKSPEVHKGIFSRQNVISKNRNPMPIRVHGSEFYVPSCELDQTVTEQEAKDRNISTSLQTSPESPEFRMSRQFAYPDTEDTERPAEIVKRPASFLLARENPILSGDLTNLLTRSGQVKSQSLASLITCEQNDDMHFSQKTQQNSDKISLQNVNISVENDKNEHFASENNRRRMNKHTVPNVTEKNTGQISQFPGNNSAFADDEVSPSSNESIKESIALETSLDKENVVTSDTFEKTDEEIKQPDVPKYFNIYDGVENAYENGTIPVEHVDLCDEFENTYENVKLPTDKHHMQIFHQIDHKNDNVTSSLDEDGTCHDSKTDTANTVKKKALRMPNTSKHFTHDHQPDHHCNETKAKLTNWNSKEKLIKGSMDDLSHLDEDPWIKNTEATGSSLKFGAESQTISTGSHDHSDISEVSSPKEKLDWMVYLNRISPLWPQVPFPVQNASPPVIDSTGQENKSVHDHTPSHISSATPPRDHISNENKKRLGSVDIDSERGDNTNNFTSRKGNLFRISPVTVSITKPVSFTGRGLVRSNSTPLSDLEQNFPNKADDKGRPVSLDMDKVFGDDCSDVTGMNSSEGMKNTSEFTNTLPTIRVEDEEANSNRLSVVSSVSTSSYDESPSSSSSDGLVGTLKHKLQAWTKPGRNRHDSEISCTSTLTSDDEDKETIHVKSGNTFEPAAKNRPSWKEDRQLEIVLREHSLGSSKLGSRMAHAYTQPFEPLTHHSPDSPSHESHPQSFASVDKVIEECESVPQDLKISDTSIVNVTEDIFPPVTKSSEISQAGSELRLQSHGSNSHDLNNESHDSNSQSDDLNSQSNHSDRLSQDSNNQSDDLNNKSHDSNTQSHNSNSQSHDLNNQSDDLNNNSHGSDSKGHDFNNKSLDLNSKSHDSIIQIHDSNNKSDESNISISSSVRHGVISETSSAFSEPPSKEETPKNTENVIISETTKGSSDLVRSDSVRSLHSNDSCYERRFSAAFDSEDLLEKSAMEKQNEDNNKEISVAKKSIREYVKDLEEKFRTQSPKIVEVRRRETGTMIRQRLETLRESALHGWRNQSINTKKPACDEKSFLFHHNRKTFTMRNDNVSEKNNKYAYLKSTKSSESFSKSVENLSKSRDDVFFSGSRDSLSSISRSRDSLNSVSDVAGNRHSAPVFTFKTNNSGHEKDANRFHYRTPDQSQTFSGNQFIHKAYSGSQHSLSESEAHNLLEEETSNGSLRSAKSACRVQEPSIDVDNLLVMKGWVKSLISKFQVKP